MNRCITGATRGQQLQLGRGSTSAAAVGADTAKRPGHVCPQGAGVQPIPGCGCAEMAAQGTFQAGNPCVVKLIIPVLLFCGAYPRFAVL